MQIRLTQRQPGVAPVGALLMLGLFALPLGAWLVHNGIISFGTCGLQRLADIPCLMCGATRATMDLLEGQLLNALALQPMVILGYVALAAWGSVSLVTFATDRHVDISLASAEKTTLKLTIVFAPLANWAYLVAAGV